MQWPYIKLDEPPTLISMCMTNTARILMYDEYTLHMYLQGTSTARASSQDIWVNSRVPTSALAWSLSAA